MACDLMPSMLTVTLEATSIAGDRMLFDERSKLKKEILDTLMWLNDWQDADYRMQDKITSIIFSNYKINNFLVH